MHRRLAGVPLPTADRRIDIERIKLDTVATAAGTFASNQCRAAAEEGVDDGVAAARTVQDRIRDERDRLHRRMHRKEVALFRRSPEIIDTAVLPNIGAVAPVLAELHIVAVAGGAVFKDEDQLVLTTIERTHAPVVLHPDAYVEQLGIDIADARPTYSLRATRRNTAKEPSGVAARAIPGLEALNRLPL